MQTKAPCPSDQETLHSDGLMRPTGRALNSGAREGRVCPTDGMSVPFTTAGGSERHTDSPPRRRAVVILV